MKRAVLFPVLTLVLILALALCSLPALAATVEAEDALISLKITGVQTGKNYVDFPLENIPGSFTTAGDTALYISIRAAEDYTATVSMGSGNSVTSSGSTATDTFTIVGSHTLVISAVKGTNTYNKNISVARAFATLSGLSIKGESDAVYLAAGSFKPGTYEYSITPDADEEILYLYPELHNDDNDWLEVKYAGSTIDDYRGEYEIDIEDFDTRDKIKITVEQEGYNTSIYYISLAEPKQGALENIYVNIGSEYDDDDDYQLELLPGFDADIRDYTVLLPYNSKHTKVNLRALMDDKGDYLTINGEEIKLTAKAVYGDAAITLSPGGSSVATIVAGSKTYTVTIYRAAAKADDDDALTDIRIQTMRGTTNSAKATALDISPSFSSGRYSYTVDMENKTGVLYVYPEAADSDAKIFVNGKLLSGAYYTLDLKQENTLKVTVYAADYEQASDYTFDLGLGAAALKSLGAYGNQGSVRFSPAFAADVFNYTGNVPNSINSVYLSLAAENSGATVRVSFNGGSYSTVSNVTQQYALQSGLNSFAVQVSSGSGGGNTYYLYLYRQPAAPVIQVSGQTLSVNNSAATPIAAYNIDGNNFLKLRDVASLLSGTAKGFSVGFDNTANLVSLIKGGAYLPVGGELVVPGSYNKAVVSPQSVMLNGSYVYPMAYNIDGNNYFLLRDLALLFDFGIEYNAAQNLIRIDTAKGYSF